MHLTEAERALLLECIDARTRYHQDRFDAIDVLKEPRVAAEFDIELTGLRELRRKVEAGESEGK